MLAYNEIGVKKFIILDGEPFEVLSSRVFRMQKRKPVNQTKLKSFLSGKVVERSFHQSEKVEEAEVEKENLKFLYSNKGEHWFCKEDDASNRFTLSENLVGDKIRFMKQNSIVTGIYFNENIIGVDIPMKVELKVTEAPGAVKGNTAQGAYKQITLETGVIVSAPLFIKEGDIVRVNTETGEYAERVS
ncbi:MAG: elongation factor P [Patescibacteria group bacterium]|nr:elongation factor P [bacterium]MDZ4241031.1 elongation factor P [Patescibacteria group bacterium]